MKTIKLKSPAKINLALEIKNRRHDGYHNLLSIMQTISLADTIKLKKSKTLQCHCNNKKIPNNNENLAFKAATEFFNHTKIKQKVKIKILKKIPTQAGLGGGSSNAATVLIGLNKIFKTNLNKQELCKIAIRIGSDVPFFIFKKTALVSGKGEKIETLKPIILKNILIVKPKNLNIQTKQAFIEHDLVSKKQKSDSSKILQIIKKIEKSAPLSTCYPDLINDFENSLNNKQIKKIKLKLKKLGAQFALMTGSGSSVFGVFENAKQAKKAKRQFKKNEFLKFLCRTI